MTTTRLTGLLILLLALPSCVLVEEDDPLFFDDPAPSGTFPGPGPNALLVENQSFSELDVIRFRTATTDYGPNQLFAPLLPGQSLVIEGLSCGAYDILLVDETNTACELNSFTICGGEDGIWTITEGLLDSCAFGVR